MSRKNKGIALLEILIVVLVASALLVFSYTTVQGQLKKSRDGKRKADLEEIKISLYDYFFDNDCFPKTLPGCGEELSVGKAKYIDSVPCDPNAIEYNYQTEDNDCPQWFKILTNMENLTDFGIEKTGCQYGCGLECDYNYGLSSSNIRVNEGCVTYYACDPSRNCSEYEDPYISRCPKVFENDPTCNDQCGNNDLRCHDSRGKKIPE